MNHLTDIIQPLVKEEIRSFKIFSARISNESGAKKTAQLFDLIKSNTYPENSPALITKVMGTHNINAFYRLKNRLSSDIERSLLGHHYNLDVKIEILNTIILAKIYITKSAYNQAINYLLKAQKLAQENELYDLLNFIYDELIVISKFSFKVNPENILKNQIENLSKYQRMQKANSLLAILNYKLRNSNFSGKDQLVLSDIKKILRQLKVNKELHDSPSLQLQIHECIKNELLHKKQFVLLEKYLIESWGNFAKQNFFAKTNHNQKIILLIWIINTYFKNKNIKGMKQYTQQLYVELCRYNNFLFKQYEWAYLQSNVITKIYSTELKAAIELIQNYREQNKSKMTLQIDLATMLNLFSLNFYSNDMKQAQLNLSQLFTKNIFNNLSNEWKLSISLLDIMLKINNNEYMYLDIKLKDLRRSYSKFLSQENYIKEKLFIQLLIKIASTPLWRLNKKIQQLISEFIDQHNTIEPGSNEILNYVIWLQSITQKQSYYTLLIQDFEQNTSVKK